MPRRFATGVELAEYLTTAVPTTPSNGVSLFARKRAGRALPNFVDLDGTVFPMCPDPLWAVKTATFQGHGNGTTVTAIGHGTSASGTAGTATVATTGLFAAMRRIRYTSGAAINSAAGIRHNQLQWWRGNAAGLGGFFYVAQFGIATWQTGMAFFAGMSGSAAAIGNADPQSLTNILGFGFDHATASEATWRFYANDAAGTATETDLGVNFPSNTSGTDWYEARIYAPPNGSYVGWSLERMNTGHLAEGVATTDLPASTTLLSPQITGQTRNGTAAIVVDLSFETVLSDF